MRSLLAIVISFPLAFAQTDTPLKLTSNCHSSSNVLCITKYLSVLPYHFYRPSPANSTAVLIGQISLPEAYKATTDAIASADFLVFDADRAAQVLGDEPTYEYMFKVNDAVHEAPVFWEEGNKLFLSQLAPPPGYLPQLVVDLNQDPPTLSEFLSDPPVYAPNGGTWFNGLVYWGASGGNKSIGGSEQRAGIRTLDPKTNKTVTLLNNHYGFYFNTVDDLIVDGKGDVWFTDPNYSWYNKLTDTPPQLGSATWRFRPSTGAVSIVEDSLAEPNGIALAPGGKTMYISDTGAVSGTISPQYPNIHGTPMNATGKRVIYKYDVIDAGMALANKRAIYWAQDWVPDGLKVASNGMVLTGAGHGVDVLDEYGTLILRIQTNYTVQNFEWVNDKATGHRTELWLMGNGGISRVRWNLAGQQQM